MVELSATDITEVPRAVAKSTSGVVSLKIVALLLLEKFKSVSKICS